MEGSTAGRAGSPPRVSHARAALPDPPPRPLQEHGDYKRQAQRTPEYIASLPEDPGWEPLPTLGEQLEKAGVFELKHTQP